MIHKCSPQLCRRRWLKNIGISKLRVQQFDVLRAWKHWLLLLLIIIIIFWDPQIASKSMEIRFWTQCDLLAAPMVPLGAPNVSKVLKMQKFVSKRYQIV